MPYCLSRRGWLRTACVLPLVAAGPGSRAAEGFELSAWPAAVPTPALSGADLEGRRWDLQALRGRAVLLNFWASWCEPCRAEMPALQQLADFHGPDRLAVLAVNFKETQRKAAQFARSTALGLPVLLDTDGELARRWGVKVFPTTVLVGTDGRARQRVTGAVDWTAPEPGRWVEALWAAKA